MSEDTEREEGIKAIIFLQSTVGKIEPRDKAARAWDSFKTWERQRTMDAYGILNKKTQSQHTAKKEV